jgi:hypothetical protein
MRSDPRETEERLRKWLDSNQVGRERLCAQLLPLMGDYSNVEPRRPKGGPDGSRDLQAVFGKSLVVWGGVGFRNSAKDDDDDKRWVKKKFAEDLTSAHSENPALKGFVFFTNVDLTPKEQIDLKNLAKEKGIGHIELFYRERLRLTLDSVDGWGYRLQFLEIPMSMEEQHTFIGRFGSRLESLLEQQRTEVNEKLKRLEFMHEYGKKVLSGSFSIRLNRSFEPQDLGHFRILLEVINLYEGDPHPTLWFGARDSYATWHHGDQNTPLFGFKTIVWSRNPDDKIQNTVIGAPGVEGQQINAFGYLYGKGPFRTLGEFDRTHVSVFVTRPLLEKIEHVGLTVNNYLLIGVPKTMVGTSEDLGQNETGPLAEWPEPLSIKEQYVPWVQLFIKGEDFNTLPSKDVPPFLLSRVVPWDLNFDTYTPIRLVETSFREEEKPK